MKFIHDVNRASLRRVRPAKERRRALVNAATRLFAERGVTAVSIADLTGEAGVAVGTFYRFFPTKESVLADVRRSALDEIRERAATVVERHIADDWWVGADAMTTEMTSFFFEDRERAQVVLSLAPDEGSQAETELLRLFAAGIEIGQEQGAVGDVDPHFAAGFVLHAAFGLIYHALNDTPPMAAEDLTAQLHRHIRRFLAR